MTESHHTPHTQPTPRVLAIDDSELIHRLLHARLKNERLVLHSAMNSRDGLRMAECLIPEMILLDIALDEMNGFEVLRRLKENVKTRDIAVIFISATSSSSDRVQGLDLGAVDFITKPFEINELIARVRNALRTQHLVKMLERHAQIDSLSGLWNRRHFDQRLQQEICLAQRFDRPLSLIMCDVDGFKRLNDQFGHPFGDLVIERIAQILSTGRTSDIACRYGGEEFGVILPSTNAERAHEVADRQRLLIERQGWAGHPDLVVTASFGVADIQDFSEGATAEQLVAAADRALLQAKKSGRNRVEIAHPHKSKSV